MPTIFFDFDSTVCEKESLDEVIALALDQHPNKESLVKAVDEITHLGMSGGLDFKESVERRLAVASLEDRHFKAVGQELTTALTFGMRELFVWLQGLGWSVYIISGGFRSSILPAAQLLGLPNSHVFSNDYKTDQNGNILSVDTRSLLWTNQGKTPVINFLKTEHSLVGPMILVGDGANDLAAFKSGSVDYFVGFGANVVRDSIKKESPIFVESVSELIEFLKTIS